MLAAGVVAGGIFFAFAYILGFSQGRVLLPALFLGLYVALAFGQVYGNRRRRPRWLEFSDRGVTFFYSSRPMRSVSWETIATVRLGRFLGDVHLNIRYVNGRVEDKAHIYGEAALELKRRFEEWQPSSIS
ncbi:MAG: hypothetical protein ACE5IQ_14490 [Candidatus Methylomirabilales bacterium]